MASAMMQQQQHHQQLDTTSAAAATNSGDADHHQANSNHHHHHHHHLLAGSYHGSSQYSLANHHQHYIQQYQQQEEQQNNNLSPQSNPMDNQQQQQQHQHQQQQFAHHQQSVAGANFYSYNHYHPQGHHYHQYQLDASNYYQANGHQVDQQSHQANFAATTENPNHNHHNHNHHHHHQQQQQQHNFTAQSNQMSPYASSRYNNFIQSFNQSLHQTQDVQQPANYNNNNNNDNDNDNLSVAAVAVAAANYGGELTTDKTTTPTTPTTTTPTTTSTTAGHHLSYGQPVEPTANLEANQGCHHRHQSPRPTSSPASVSKSIRGDKSFSSAPINQHHLQLDNEYQPQELTELNNHEIGKKVGQINGNKRKKRSNANGNDHHTATTINSKKISIKNELLEEDPTNDSELYSGNNTNHHTSPPVYHLSGHQHQPPEAYQKQSIEANTCLFASNNYHQLDDTDKLLQHQRQQDDEAATGNSEPNVNNASVGTGADGGEYNQLR